MIHSWVCVSQVSKRKYSLKKEKALIQTNYEQDI